jgi:hypothetical protein
VKSVLLALAILVVSAASASAQDYIVVTPGNVASYRLPDATTLDLLGRARILDGTGAEIGRISHVLGDPSGSVVAVAVVLTAEPAAQVIVPYTDLRPQIHGEELAFTTSLLPVDFRALPTWQ